MHVPAGASPQSPNPINPEHKKSPQAAGFLSRPNGPRIYFAAASFLAAAFLDFLLFLAFLVSDAAGAAGAAAAAGAAIAAGAAGAGLAAAAGAEACANAPAANIPAIRVARILFIFQLPFKACWSTPIIGDLSTTRVPLDSLTYSQYFFDPWSGRSFLRAGVFAPGVEARNQRAGQQDQCASGKNPGAEWFI